MIFHHKIMFNELFLFVDNFALRVDTRSCLKSSFSRFRNLENVSVARGRCDTPCPVWRRVRTFRKSQQNEFVLTFSFKKWKWTSNEPLAPLGVNGNIVNGLLMVLRPHGRSNALFSQNEQNSVQVAEKLHFLSFYSKS